MVFDCLFPHAADFAETIDRFVNAVWRRRQIVHTSGARGAKSDQNISDRKFKTIKMLNLHRWVLRVVVEAPLPAGSLWSDSTAGDEGASNTPERVQEHPASAFKIKVSRRMFPVRFVWLFCQTCDRFTLRKSIYLLFTSTRGSYFTWTLLCKQKIFKPVKTINVPAFQALTDFK